MAGDGAGCGGAMSVRLQRRVVGAFLGACAATAAFQIALLLPLALDPAVADISWEPSAWHNPVLLPSLLLLLLAPALLSLRLSDRYWESSWPQAAASLVLLLAVFGLEGAGLRAVRWTASVWGALALLVQCAAVGLESRRWVAWVGLYLGVLAASVVLAITAPGDAFAFAAAGHGAHAWWQELVAGLNLVLAVALTVLPTAISARELMGLERRARTLLASTHRQLELENKLLDALVPAAVTARLLRGDYLVADDIAEGTAMFCYLHQYQNMVLQYGAGPCIGWINRVFSRLDASVASARSITKVETFNNFVVLFSSGSAHVQDCIRLAAAMLAAADREVRPDGKATTLKIGLSSGPFTTGLIGLQAPRYSIFGDTVNTASRMASSAQPCTIHDPFIHLSPSSRQLLPDSEAEAMLSDLGGLVLSEHGMTEIKGKGAMRTHVVSGPRTTPPSRFPPAGPPPSAC